MGITEFFSMGGFGAYIWSAFSITFVFMIAEVVYLKYKRQATIRRLQRMVQLNGGEQNESQA